MNSSYMDKFLAIIKNRLEILEMQRFPIDFVLIKIYIHYNFLEKMIGHRNLFK